MTATFAQELQHTLSNTQLRAVLFAVQMEARRYKDLPYEDLPIEIATLLRSRSYLANFVHGIGTDQATLLVHEWEIFLVAMKLELQRYDCMIEELKPKFVEDLRAAVHVVQGALLLDHKKTKKSRGAQMIRKQDDSRKRIMANVRGLFSTAKADVLVADAFHACHVNKSGRYRAFAFLGEGTKHTVGVMNDGKVYRRLLKEGFFVQAKSPAKEFKRLPKGVRRDADGMVPVVYVTRDLVAKVLSFLKKQGKEIK